MIGRTVSAAPIEEVPPELVDGMGIIQATYEGDTEKLRAMVDKHLPGFQGDLVAAAYYRTQWKLRESSSAASACVEKASRDIKRQAIDYFLCGQILAGNYVLTGQVARGAAMATTVRTRVRPILEHWAKGGAFTLGDLDRLDWAALTSLPDATFTVATGDDIIVDRAWPPGTRPHEDAAYVRGSDAETSDASTGYVLNVAINHINIPLPLDTGSAVTVLTTADAAKLGVIDTVPYGTIVGLGIAPKNGVTMRLGVIRTMTIARRHGGDAITVENAPVMVGGAVSLLGIDLVARLGPVAMREYELTIHPRDYRKLCSTPIRVASAPMGGPSLVLAYRIDGRVQRLMFDSGDNSYLSGTSSATATRLSQTPTAFEYQDVTGVRHGQYFPAQVTLGDDVSASPVTIRTHPERTYPLPYVLGTGGLHSFDIAMDFDGGTACMLPRPAVSP